MGSIISVIGAISRLVTTIGSLIAAWKAISKARQVWKQQNKGIRTRIALAIISILLIVINTSTIVFLWINSPRITCALTMARRLDFSDPLNSQDENGGS